MSDKDRRKKDGQDTQKKTQRSKAASEERARQPHEGEGSKNTDQGDWVQQHKEGSRSDRTFPGAR